MSVSIVIGVVILCMWLVVGVLVLFEVMSLFSEKVMTVLMCVIFAENIARLCNKEKRND